MIILLVLTKLLPSDHRLLRVVLLFLDLVDIPKFVGVPALCVGLCAKIVSKRIELGKCMDTIMSHRVRCRCDYFFANEGFLKLGVPKLGFKFNTKIA